MKHLLFLIFIMCSVSISAQDVIVKKNGSTILSKVLEVNAADIKYKKFSNQNGPTYTISIVDVMAINYENGEKDEFGDTNNTANPLQVKSIPTSQTSNLVPTYFSDFQDDVANADAIQSFNQEQQISYLGDKKDKDAKFIYGLFNVKSDSKLVDNNMEITVASLRANEAEASRAYMSYPHTRNGTPSYCAIAVTVKNKTGQTLYIDLGNTFFIRNSSPSPYYVPSATQTTTSTTTGASINMGAVAGALGVGGRAGTLASGVNVGGANTNSTSVITCTQRVIPVPAHSSKILDLQLLFPESMTKIYGAKFIHQTKHRLHCLFDKDERISLGEERVFDENNSPIQWGILVTYAYDENISNPCCLKASDYTVKMIGCKYSMAHSFDGAISKGQLPETFRDLVSFVAWQGR